MRIRLGALITGLMVMGSAAMSATTLDDLRLRWRGTLTGGANLDTANPQVKSALSSVQPVRTGIGLL